ncbi:hypothetical protein [Cellulosimicrobium funkei]
MSRTSSSPAFDAFRTALATDSGLRGELERALDLNVNRVNPSDPGGRFISGGAVEWILAAAAYKAGVISIPGGHSAKGFDLRDLLAQARGLWSVKNQTSASKSEYRLTNGLGGAGNGFTEPTVFLSPHLPGVVFVDPAAHPETVANARKKPDAWVISFRHIAQHAQNHPECVAACRLPVNPGTGTHDPGMDYTQELLAPEHFPRLSTLFREAKPASGSLVTELKDLVALKESGAISEDQFTALVASLTKG